VKPLRLTVEGFTSFRDRVEVDFADLDLFALTGPTGVGKSSLIDAMVFALYGQVPRVGDDYRQLVSHGAERMSVSFDFAVGGNRYRIARVVRRAGASQQRMERAEDDGTTVPIADKVKEIRNEVERILGLDYDGFTRSVVLPQGQFDSFLKGEPKERRKILVALLNLGVYERMQQIANKRSSDARSEVEFVKQQLERDYAGVSSVALAECRELQAAAESGVADAGLALEVLGRTAALAQSLRQDRREVTLLNEDEAAQAEIVERAAATVAGAADRRASLASKLEVVRRDIERATGGEARLATLVGAAPLAQQLEQKALRLARLATEGEVREGSLRGAESERSDAEEGLVLLEERRTEARRREEGARAERDEAQRPRGNASSQPSAWGHVPCVRTAGRITTEGRRVPPRRRRRGGDRGRGGDEESL
jgi:exonuclease SbcC